ncbi:hypothetical protein BDU57DRAFT_522412 [Ampelomyces quisqualis]|uniref:Uncharacterized protein n=1 Tax=Ampelomyces quisqualis TaxID=50730 RepID=A0A6A5Q9Y0_AMPQU|nr:hypothetical protein BDU57DRAFT_522412 [Ampelomyces quisqualis]
MARDLNTWVGRGMDTWLLRCILAWGFCTGRLGWLGKAATYFLGPSRHQKVDWTDSILYANEV